ncbi:MAG: hypothetical protein ACLQFW_13030 [Xanthobacteraceae bacterium]
MLTDVKLHAMNLADVFPPNGRDQPLHCDRCGKPMDLVFKDFHENVSGVDITIRGLPYLRCDACSQDYLLGKSRFAIIEHHRLATEKGVTRVNVTRRKLTTDFGFTTVRFLYDPDDYYYIPGLAREFNVGFLTPVFFNRRVLLKYDASPDYEVRFASPTYGTIVGPDGLLISFGINKNGRVIMWLGDIAGLPEAEQYYLRSENVESDHSIGSEFYDGQIECVFTEPPAETKLFALRSDFVEACFRRLGTKVAHLDEEVLELAASFNPPVVDTEKERRHVADTLNKIYIESFDNGALGKTLKGLGADPAKLASLKRLQAVLERVVPGHDIATLLSPFFTLYDLRVAYSHLASTESAAEILKTVTDRLALPEGSGLLTIYNRLLESLAASFEALTTAIRPPNPSADAGDAEE